MPPRRSFGAGPLLSIRRRCYLRPSLRRRNRRCTNWVASFNLSLGFTFGRANEIFYTFLRDELERIKGTLEETGLTPYDGSC